MNFAHLCKQCTCCCLFALSTLLMLITLSLALNDMSIIAAHQTLLQHVVNTPLPQLACSQICDVWFTQQSGGLCCDRYDMGVCVQKDQCKVDYVRNRQVSVDVLDNDLFHQFVVAIVCGLIMLMVAFRKGKEIQLHKAQQQLDAKNIEIIKKELEEVRKEREKRGQRVGVSIFGSHQLFNNYASKTQWISAVQDITQQISTVQDKTQLISTVQDNRSKVSELMMEMINSSQVSQQIHTDFITRCSQLVNSKRYQNSTIRY